MVTQLIVSFKGCLSALLSIVTLSLFAQTTYYSRNGATAPRNWDEADSWTLSSDGTGSAAAIPGRTDNVVILGGHNIIVDNIGDNGGIATSADDISTGNIGGFPNSGVSNFYQTGNIYVAEGATLTLSVRSMLGGSTIVNGTISTSGDFIITGKLQITSNATTSIGDDFILTGFSETLIYNTTTSADDIYIDHTDALLCGNNTVDVTDAISYRNGATSDQICADMTIVSNGGTNSTSGTGTNTIGTDQTLLPTGGVWRYLDDGSDQGTAWQASGFDDSGWSSGNAELGYGDGDENTTISYGANANNKYTTTYFRTSFYVEDRTDYNKFVASINYDDGVVVYLNGTEVIRDNMPVGTITSSTFASGNVTNENLFKDFDLSVFDLANGTNYVAVEVHQRNLTSSDISFDMSITGSYSTYLVNAGETWNYLDDGSDQGIAWTGTSFDDSGWSSGTAEFGYGDGDETTTVGYGGDAANKYTTTYFRKSFTNTDSDVFSIQIGLKRDDGAVVYLNGTEIVRDNMPTGTITYSTFASGAEGGADEDTFFEFEVDASSLVVGTNVIAVEVHQSNLTSSDISFDLTLELVNPGPLLPVTLLDFIGVQQDNQVVLQWQTASELNNDFFRVEKSTSGLQFTEMNRIKGAGTVSETSSYVLIDRNPSEFGNYYRLSQQDYDGTTEILKTIYVPPHAQTTNFITVHPNPAKESWNISMYRIPSHIELYDLSGTTHLIQPIFEHNNMIIPARNLNKGIYVMRFNIDGQESTIRLIKR